MANDDGVTQDERKQLVGNLALGAQLVHRNAVQLFEEANLLHQAGFLSRALFLHQISMEECAKIEQIGAWATSALSGEKVDVKRISLAMANHKAKNYTNAYMLPPTPAEEEARQRADWKGTVEAFNNRKAAFHQESNEAKNASLYVDFKDNRFSTPQEQITAEMVTDIAGRNSTFLGLMHLKVEMLSKWENKVDELSVDYKHLKQRLEQLKAESPDSPEKAMAAILEELLKDATTRSASPAPPESATDQNDIEGKSM